MEDSFSSNELSADETFGRNGSCNCAQWRQCKPERKLRAPVLKDGLSMYRGRLPDRAARFREVEHWFFRDQTERFFAFKPLCARLNSERRKHPQGPAQRVRAAEVGSARKLAHRAIR